MTENAQPILVCNPYTEKIMNVEPLFSFYDFIDASEAKEMIEESIRLLVLYTDDVPESDMKYTLSGLYQMRDLFKGLDGCAISAPRQTSK